MKRTSIFPNGNPGWFKKGEKKPPFTAEHKRKISEALKGKKYGKELGEIGYIGIHVWLKRTYGNPPRCMDCGVEGKMVGEKQKHWNIQWSNKDHKHRRVIEDYTPRCPKCHKEYDVANGLRKR